MKDLGGGGLSCCLSETADNLKKGFEIELSNVHLKHNDITDTRNNDIRISRKNAIYYQ